MVAPVLPGNDAPQIQLRVRLVNLSNQTTLDQETLAVPITSDAPPPLRIASFTAATPSVDYNALVAGNISNEHSGPDTADIFFQF